ncbi:BA75_00076T0 [Komagataella pastoris]|uniref:BA75_00076T0 n=1 Tax=Komagataella pastoris TaxID=4922 RepID=A0A1B2J9F4_PICPA|nr:BA75_00076T0 [Komagataella pastoris]
MLNQKQWIVKQLKRSKSLSEDEKGEVWNQIQAVLVEAIRKKKEDVNDWERQGLPFFDKCDLQLCCEKDSDEPVLQSSNVNPIIEATQRIAVSTDSPGDLPMDEDDEEDNEHNLEKKGGEEIERYHEANEDAEFQNDREIVNLGGDEEVVDEQLKDELTNKSIEDLAKASVQESDIEPAAELRRNPSEMSMEIEEKNSVANGVSTDEGIEEKFEVQSVEAIENDVIESEQVSSTEDQQKETEKICEVPESQPVLVDQIEETGKIQLKDLKQSQHRISETDEKNSDDKITTRGDYQETRTAELEDKESHTTDQSTTVNKGASGVVNDPKQDQDHEMTDTDPTPRPEVITFRAFPRKGYLNRVTGSSGGVAISSQNQTEWSSYLNSQPDLDQSDTQSLNPAKSQTEPQISNQLSDDPQSTPKRPHNFPDKTSKRSSEHTPTRSQSNSPTNSPKKSPNKTRTESPITFPSGKPDSTSSPASSTARSHPNKSLVNSPIISSADSPKELCVKSPARSPGSHNFQTSLAPRESNLPNFTPAIVTSQSPVLSHSQSADYEDSSEPNIDSKPKSGSARSPKDSPRLNSESLTSSGPTSNPDNSLFGRESAPNSQQPSNTVTNEVDKLNLSQQVKLLRKHFVNISNRSDDLAMQQEIESIFEKTAAIENLEKRVVFKTVCSEALVSLFLQRSYFSTQVLPYLQFIAENKSTFDLYREQHSYEYHLCLLTCYYIYHRMEAELDKFAQCIVDHIEALDSKLDTQGDQPLPMLLCKIALSILYAYLDRNYHDLFKSCFQLVTIIDTEDQMAGKEFRLQSIRFSLATFLNREREKAITVIQQKFTELPLRVLIFELRFYSEDECLGFLDALNLLNKLKEPQNESDDLVLRLA